LRDSNLLAGLVLSTLSALTLVGAGCSGRTIVAVDPSCGEGGATGCTGALVKDLVGFWRLDDAPGSATARDSSGWENNGTLVDLDPGTVWVTGGAEGGGALSVQGNGYVNVPDSASIDSITAQVTIAAWIFLTGPIASGSYATAISRQIGTGYGQHYHLSVNDQHQPIIFITTTTAGQQVIGGPPTFPQQTWVHLAGTYDGSQIRLYVNGAEVATGAATGPFAAETNPVILSGNGNTDSHTISEFVPGQLDQVMLYGRALGANEIAQLAAGCCLPSGTFHPDGGP
jgi:hypothetical protein